jgi:hypothetical protein
VQTIHPKGSLEWMALNANRLQRTAHLLEQLMDQGGLSTEGREHLRKAFQFATDVGGERKAAAVEKKWQEKNKSKKRERIY